MFVFSQMAQQETTETLNDTKDGSFCETSDGNNNTNSCKLESFSSDSSDLNTNSASSLIQQQQTRTLHVFYREVLLEIPIHNDTTLAIFKAKLKVYASRRFRDFNLNIPNEQLLVTMRGRIIIDDENEVMANTVDSPDLYGGRNTVFVEEAKRVYVTIPNDDFECRHGLFVFPIRSGFEFKYRIYELMEKKYVHFDLFKKGEDMRFNGYLVKSGDEFKVCLDTRQPDTEILVEGIGDESSDSMVMKVNQKQTVKELMWQLYVKGQTETVPYNWLLDGKRLMSNQRLEHYDVADKSQLRPFTEPF